jgi:hypothetical protein
MLNSPAGARFFASSPLSIKSVVTYWKVLFLPPTIPLLHTSLRLAVLASAPPNPIPQSLTGASRGAIEGVYVPTISLVFRARN